ncbi:MAG TPA: hypothetical protein VD763_09590, partial [Candidatus Saccharimonadales bacterium]|nr:hypothetical protein [Candidatus Saccharimonadales bacterium]
MRLAPHGRRALAVVAGLAITVAACASPPPSAAPSFAVTAPVSTPDPHLADPATADAVFLALGAAGIRISATNAAAGTAGVEPVKRINATYLGWPLTISQYSTSASLRKATEGWEPVQAPGQGEPPISIVGMNILLAWGPATSGQPKTPDPKKTAALDSMLGALDPLLSPLRARTVVPVRVAGATTAPIDD